MELDKIAGYIARNQITMAGVAKGIVAFSLRQYNPDDGTLTITESGHITSASLDLQIQRAQSIIDKATALKGHIYDLTKELPEMPIKDQSGG